MSTYLFEGKPDLETLLEHHGVKGMHWGVVRNGKVTGGASRVSRASQKEFLKTEQKRINSGSKDLQKQFKSDVKSAKSGYGLPGSKITGTYSGKRGEETSLFTGSFKNNKGEVVTENYANLVLSKAVQKQDFKRKMAAGAIFAATVFVGTR